MITNFAVALQTWSTQDTLRFAKVFETEFQGPCTPGCASGVAGNHLITVWMEITPCPGAQAPPCLLAADRIHIAGNRLALGFTGGVASSDGGAVPQAYSGLHQSNAWPTSTYVAG